MLKLIYEENDLEVRTIISNVSDLMINIEKIHPYSYPYIIIERDNGDYMQCAGSKDRLTIEVRLNQVDSFKHYILGKKVQSKIWGIIECKVGPIKVLKHEILTIEDALELFKIFFETGQISNKYRMRNITKRFSST